MSYTPPPGNNVQFVFKALAKPTASPISFVFGATGATPGTLSLSAAQTLLDAIQVATLQNLAPLSLTAAQTMEQAVQVSALKSIARLVSSQALLANAQTATLSTVSSLSAAQALQGSVQVATFAPPPGPLSFAASQTLLAANQVALLALISNLASSTAGAAPVQNANFAALARIVANQSGLSASQIARLQHDGPVSNLSADQLLLVSVNGATLSVTPLGPLSLYADQLMPAPANSAFLVTTLIDRNGRTYVVKPEFRGFLIEPQARSILLEI